MMPAHVANLKLFVFHHYLPTMPKKSWASPEQQTWLLAQLADFRQAQEAKTTPTFFLGLYKKFHEKWPLASPSTEEIFKVEGNEEQAQTLKQKASENVSWVFAISLKFGSCFINTYTSESMSISTTKLEERPQAPEPERY
jgi:hypothetical protein